MKTPKSGPVPHVEAADPANASRNFEDFTRRILAVPKKEIDAKIAKEKNAKKKRD
jgi:hypothetical protein